MFVKQKIIKKRYTQKNKFYLNGKQKCRQEIIRYKFYLFYLKKRKQTKIYLIVIEFLNQNKRKNT